MLPASPSCAVSPSLVRSVAPLNGGGGAVRCCPPVLCCPCSLHGVPCFRIRSGFLYCSRSSRIVLLSLFLSVVPCCVAGCGMAVGGVRVCGLFPLSSSSLRLPLLLFVLVFGVVRAQPCEHARYPRTPLCLSCRVLCSLFTVFLFTVFLRAPPFFCWNGGGCLPCVGVLCWHDCDG